MYRIFKGHSSCLSGFAGQVKSRQVEISVTQGFQKQKLQAAALYVYTEPVQFLNYEVERA